jgi:hypothetical protein
MQAHGGGGECEQSCDQTDDPCPAWYVQGTVLSLPRAQRSTTFVETRTITMDAKYVTLRHATQWPALRELQARTSTARRRFTRLGVSHSAMAKAKLGDRYERQSKLTLTGARHSPHGSVEEGRELR